MQAHSACNSSTSARMEAERLITLAVQMLGDNDRIVRDYLSLALEELEIAQKRAQPN